MNKKILSILKYIFLSIIGGGIYYSVEVLWRGYSHWTMFILGGLCFVTVGLINNIISWNMKFELQCLIGSIIITLLELITGIIVNIILKWNIWDYSDLLFNIMGQICLPFSLIWFVLSGLIIVLDDFIRYKFFNERKPYYKSLFFNK